MSDEQLRQEAQGRNLEALQQLIKNSLPLNSIQICGLQFRRNCLQISLESESVPNPDSILPTLQTLITQLQIDALATLEIYGQKVGNELPYWKETLDLSAQGATPSTPASSGSPQTVLTWRGNATSVPQSSVPPTPPMMKPPAPASAKIDHPTVEPTPQKPASGTLKHQLGPTEASAAPPSTPRANPPQSLAEQIIQRYAAGERDFPKIDLSNGDFHQVNFSLANFEETKWAWANLAHARLGRSRFTGANFRHANLSDANLQSAQLQGADFQGADLQGANLSWAELRGANFTDANLTDANLHQANLERVTMPDGTYLD